MSNTTKDSALSSPSSLPIGNSILNTSEVNPTPVKRRLSTKCEGTGPGANSTPRPGKRQKQSRPSQELGLHSRPATGTMRATPLKKRKVLEISAQPPAKKSRAQTSLATPTKKCAAVLGKVPALEESQGQKGDDSKETNLSRCPWWIDAETGKYIGTARPSNKPRHTFARTPLPYPDGKPRYPQQKPISSSLPAPKAQHSLHAGRLEKRAPKKSAVEEVSSGKDAGGKQSLKRVEARPPDADGPTSTRQDDAPPHPPATPEEAERKAQRAAEIERKLAAMERLTRFCRARNERARSLALFHTGIR